MLSSLIRKRGTGGIATAIPAISATRPNKGPATVARIATVAVANPDERQSEALAAEGETSIRELLALIDTTDPATLAEVFAFGRDRTDDRRTCTGCANLAGRTCQAARSGEIPGVRRGYDPVADLRRRCEGYAPGPDDPDRRHGRERWPNGWG